MAAWLSLTMRLTVSLVCLTAALGKVRSRSTYRDFVGFLAKAGVPTALAPPAGAAVVVSEFAVAGLAGWPATGMYAAAAGAVLFAAFTAGVGGAVASGRVPPCRCFGTAGVALNRSHVVRNALLAAVAAGGAGTGLLARPPAPTPAGWWLAGCGAAVLAVTALFWEDLVSVLVEDVIPAGAAKAGAGAGPAGGVGK